MFNQKQLMNQITNHQSDPFITKIKSKQNDFVDILDLINYLL